MQFHNLSLLVARWLLRHQSSCLHATKEEEGRERDSSEIRETKDCTETVGRDCSYVTWPELCQVVTLT